MSGPGGSVGERLPRRIPYGAHSTRLPAFMIAWQASELPRRGQGRPPAGRGQHEGALPARRPRSAG